MPTSTVHSFQLSHGQRPVKLALGHKHHGWYLLFAQSHRTADSRQVARLDSPSPPPRSSASRRASSTHRHRFWFSQSAQSGWEHEHTPESATLLDLLLSLDLRQPPLFAVVDHDPETGARKVEVLLREEMLAHFCEGCGRWETAGGNALRWFMVRGDALPGYLCPPCHAKDWCGARMIRYVKRALS